VDSATPLLLRLARGIAQNDGDRNLSFCAKSQNPACV